MQNVIKGRQAVVCLFSRADCGGIIRLQRLGRLPQRWLVLWCGVNAHLAKPVRDHPVVRRCCKLTKPAVPCTRRHQRVSYTSLGLREGTHTLSRWARFRTDSFQLPRQGTGNDAAMYLCVNMSAHDSRIAKSYRSSTKSQRAYSGHLMVASTAVLHRSRDR